jgi:Secretion system C-terminal sorting domain
MKMKSSIILTSAISLSLKIFGQNPLTCSDLQVEEIYIDTTGAWALTIGNSCSDCASAMSGPVYCELMVISTIAPFDTLAANNCYCFQTPENNGERTYSINPFVSVIPPLSTLRVSFIYCGCESIPFASGLSIDESASDKGYSILPNPSNSHPTLSTYIALKEATLKIFNSSGQQVRQFKNISGKSFTLDSGDLSGGLYFIEVVQDNRTILKDRIILEQ